MRRARAGGRRAWSASGQQGLSGGCTIAAPTFAQHFQVLAQWYLSVEANVLDIEACKFLVVTSDVAEVEALRTLLHTKLGERLPRLLRQLTITDFPSALRRLSPGTQTPLPRTKDVGRYGRIYICTKKFAAARYAHEVLDTEHVLVTDSEAYVWKPLSIADLFATAAARPAVWYADAPALAARVRPGRARVDANWCSLHVFRDMRAVGSAERERLQPSPTATLFEDLGFLYPRRHFRRYWSAVESAWGNRSFYDAVVAAYEAKPQCIGVGFWGEVSWRLFLYNHASEFEPRNATAAIEESFGAPFAMRSAYVNARLELLWRAVSNESYAGFVDFYSRQGLPFFRSEFRNARGVRGSRSGCLPVQLITAISAPAATFQVNSAVPNWVWSDCAAHLPAGAAHPWLPHRVHT